MKELAERVKDYWMATGCAIRPGASEAQFAVYESTYGVSLSDEVRAYFSVVDGMEDGDTDDALYSFLPLERVKSVPEALAQFGGVPDYRRIVETLPDAQHCFVFIDYLIYSHVYAFRLSPASSETSPVIWICGAEHRVMAESLAAFFEAYLGDPDAVLFPPDL